MSLLPHRGHQAAQHPQPQPPDPPPMSPPEHEPPPAADIPPGGSPPRQTPDGKTEEVHSPSQTPGERGGEAPEEHRENPQREAIAKGRDPGPNQHDETGGAPGGSPGRKLDGEMHEKDSTQGAAAPEPRGPGPEFKSGKDHKPGEFEQPARWDAPVREYGDHHG